jgi:glutamate synthase (NADPH/NADH) small chain
VVPIEIGRLQSYATQKAIASDKKLFNLHATIGKKVAVIGAGPAGIGCACELRLHGVEVDVFEAKSLPSGLTVHGVAPYKITNSEVMTEMAYLEKQFGYKVFYEKQISTREDLEVLEKNYDAIFLGIGLGETSTLGLKGEDLENVFGAVEMIEQLRMKQQEVAVPSKVIVLGGGNTAMDAASESARMGAEQVILAYRRSKEEMGAYAFEYELAKSVGVKGMFNASPVEIIGRSVDEGKGEEVPFRGFRGKESNAVGSVKFIRTQTVNGKLIEIPGSEFIESCDWVIMATGQSKQTSLCETIGKIDLNKNGTIVISDDYQTSNQKYFAAGDAVSGGQEVVNAVADGKKAAQGIIQYLNV